MLSWTVTILGHGALPCHCIYICSQVFPLICERFKLLRITVYKNQLQSWSWCRCFQDKQHFCSKGPKEYSWYPFIFVKGNNLFHYWKSSFHFWSWWPRLHPMRMKVHCMITRVHSMTTCVHSMIVLVHVTTPMWWTCATGVVMEVSITVVTMAVVFRMWTAVWVAAITESI